MRVLMKFGKTGYPLFLSDDWNVTVLTKESMPVIQEPQVALRNAFDAPVASKSLEAEARGRSNVCIVICDITRPVPNQLILPVLVERLTAAGIALEKITILIATGLHRPATEAEIKELVGSDPAAGKVRVVNHFARNDDGHVFLGHTEQGTPVKIDRQLMEADLRIAVGLVEPHILAGYSGGRKVIVPGVAHRDTITYLHSARFVENERTANCVLDGNPTHGEQLRMMEMIGRLLSVNTVIDENRNLSFVNFGEIVESHKAAVDFARRYVEIPVRRKFKTIVTCGAGYPLDKTFHQATKGLLAVTDVLEDGGDVFLLSECSDGIGSPDFVSAQQRMLDIGIEPFLESLREKHHADVDEWVSELLIRALRKGTVNLFTRGLSPSEKTLTGVNVVDALDDALKKAQAQSSDAGVLVIPEGPYVFPVYAPL